MTLQFLVLGEVQGVGFRYFVARRATRLGLHGWTRNLPDGRVEVVVQGEDSALASLEEALRTGPPRARVFRVEKVEISDEIVSHKSFDIKP